MVNKTEAKIQALRIINLYWELAYDSKENDKQAFILKALGAEEMAMATRILSLEEITKTKENIFKKLKHEVKNT